MHDTNSSSLSGKSCRSSPTIGLTLAALGVVFGDIGTSPLYAIRECFFGSHAIAINPPHVLGVLSLVFWSLIIVISIDYLGFIMRAHNNGEGGVFALLALLTQKKRSIVSRRVVVLLGLAGAALLYGDGIITPAISVLSAVEGLEIVTPLFHPYITSIAIVILCILFALQRRGTAKLGALFGPIVLVWFLTLGVLGIRGIMLNWSVLAAINPFYAIDFVFEIGFDSLWVLGAVFLAVTGGEALYADMGHFGAKAIRLGWFTIALPCLLLNYFGQGALLLGDPANIVGENPFYSLSPSWAITPLVILATMATVTASQAVISGAFSLTRQAVQLGYLPRLAIRHTSSEEIGQIYIPKVNAMLFVATVWLVLEFHSSSNLAAAYGFAVATTMMITTILMFFVARDIWKWSMFIPGIGWIGIFTIKVVFFMAAVVKIPHGGWFPIMIGALVMLVMTTWWRGRQILAERLQASSLPIEEFLEKTKDDPHMRVPGNAIFMARDPDSTPRALFNNFTHNKVLHEHMVILVIKTAAIPYINPRQQIHFSDLGNGFYRIIAEYGFMENPHVPRLLYRCRDLGLSFSLTEATFFLGREVLIPSEKPGMAIWREHLFAFMARNAERATQFFQIPPDNVIEIGMQVEL